MWFGVLGPLVAEDERGPLELKGPRHRAVLARLLIARGRVVPMHTLVDDLWEQPPEGAVGAIQTFVAALRRVLEPDRPPRTPARLLVTAAPGYALRAEDVDAWRFEAAVAECGQLLARRKAAAALSQVDDALAWWRGPAYAEFADEPWARGEISRLDELRLLALERRAQALLDLGRAAEAVPDLEAHVDAHPWREDAWRLLVLARYRAGRQGDALETLRRARQVLVTELGLDPGVELRELESDILGQAPRLNPVEAPKQRLVARADELGQLAQAADGVLARERPALVLIAGEAGAGKTALATAFAEQLESRGWTTVWGDNPDHEGLPAAWPWTRILDSLPGPAPVPEKVGDPAVARFHWHRAVAARLAAHAPLLVVLDDLHWAGEETLALLASVLGEQAGQVLLVGTYRTTDISPELAALLGRVARAEPTRIYLGGLRQDAVAELVEATTGRTVDVAAAAVIHQRSGGNPFYVRELARVLAAGGAVSTVPEGVRDVVRYRVGELPEDVREVLRQAAVAGTEFELDLVPGDPLDAVEMAVRKGFLEERGARRFQFAHALVRDTLYQDLSAARRARWHEAVAERLERLRPQDVEALAHHFVLAESPRAARYARAAAEQAEGRFAMHEAARWWADALAFTSVGRERLELIMGLVRALAVTGSLDRAREYRAEALTLAEELSEPGLTARVLIAFDVPAIWTENDDPVLAGRIVELAERVLPETEGVIRARLLATLALELRNVGGERARAAAREAESIARELGDPASLAFALNARFMQSFESAGLAPERARIGAELVELAARNSLVSFEVLGHLILLQAHSALADFGSADRHAAEADRLGEDYGIPLVGVFTQWYRALRTAVSGAPAEAAYRAAAARLSGSGMSGLDNGILSFALYCTGLAPESADFGAYTPWCRPGGPMPDSPRDLLFEARTCLQARQAVERGDVSTMERLYRELLPAARELAGAGSGLLTLPPVAHYLAELAEALGRDGAEHRAQASAVAKRAGAPQWIEP
ncbi:AAA family ATPase [Amycolatopsis acidicola]|uniref:AAA family ATPase n=1 Tax=Amycolatopsis acidicola TaxID=2596893 RepID=A0A5N0V2Z8_9PSEU|nr:BTAD domain-containing putative transcriptional regulator [Amycolatopsis acidicola]KAA9158924.1 AAA family ATPase [Amycolatopsis acidicola]